MTTPTRRHQAPYIGATAAELAALTTADKIAGGVSQKALFHRRGHITLSSDALVLTGWGDAGDLILRRGDIRSVRTEYTRLYGRLLGGLLESGKPLILDTVPAGVVYLLVDRREFMETTDDRAWARRIIEWLAGPGA